MTTTLSHVPKIQPPSDLDLYRLNNEAQDAHRLASSADAVFENNLGHDSAPQWEAIALERFAEYEAKRDTYLEARAQQELWQRQCDAALLDDVLATQDDMIGQEGVG